MRYITILSVLLFIGLNPVFSQIQDNSPYSRFGLGDLNSPTLSANSAMGGLTAAYNSIYYLNPSNPATYSVLRYTSFETGMDATFSRLVSGDEQLNKQTGGLSYFALGFPLLNPLNRMTKKKDFPFDWGASFGLVPHSRVAYNIESTSSEVFVDDLKRYSTGKGQRYKLYFGTGFRYKGLSGGFNANYLFGKITRELFVDFQNPVAYLNDISTSNINTSGWYWDLGLQYQYTLNKLSNPLEERKRRNKTHLILGATMTPGTNVSLSGEDALGRTRDSYANYESVRENSNFAYDDTIYNNVVDDVMRLPSSFGLGITIKKDSRFTIGAEYSITNWQEYENAVSSETLTNTWRGAFGIEITPNERSLDFLQKVSYRAGAHYATDPRTIDDQQLTNYGVTLGFGLPIVLPRGVPSFVNVGFELGRQGNPDLLQETYFKTSLSFTFNDNTWFYRRKYQ